jgi:hypothetical protein
MRILELAVIPDHVYLSAPPDVVYEKLIQTMQAIPPARCLSNLQALN